MQIEHNHNDGTTEITLTNEEVVRLLAEGLQRHFPALHPGNQGGHGVALACDIDDNVVKRFKLVVDPR